MFTFWYSTYKRDKFLFIFFLLFIIGQTLFTIKGVETFPFWNYGMYSAPMSTPKFLQYKYLEINGKEYSISRASSPLFLEYQLKYYLKKDKSDKQQFGPWLKKYLEKTLTEEINSIKLIVRFHSNEKPYTIIKKNVISLYPN